MFNSFNRSAWLAALGLSALATAALVLRRNRGSVSAISAAAPTQAPPEVSSAPSSSVTEVPAVSVAEKTGGRIVKIWTACCTVVRFVVWDLPKHLVAPAHRWSKLLISIMLAWHGPHLLYKAMYSQEAAASKISIRLTVPHTLGSSGDSVWKC